MRIIADIEADGLLKATRTKPAATRIHCMCVHNIDNGETYAFADHPGYRPMRDGLAMISAADFVVGHFFREYDKPMLKKFYNYDVTATKLLDTLDLCHLLLDLDAVSREDRVLVEQGVMPRNCIRKMSLESWGYRLGRHKVEHHDWKNFSAAMIERCIGDVLLNRDLYRLLEPLADAL